VAATPTRVELQSRKGLVFQDVAQATEKIPLSTGSDVSILRTRNWDIFTLDGCRWPPEEREGAGCKRETMPMQFRHRNWGWGRQVRWRKKVLQQTANDWIWSCLRWRGCQAQCHYGGLVKTLETPTTLGSTVACRRRSNWSRLESDKMTGPAASFSGRQRPNESQKCWFARKWCYMVVDDGVAVFVWPILAPMPFCELSNTRAGTCMRLGGLSSSASSVGHGTEWKISTSKHGNSSGS